MTSFGFIKQEANNHIRSYNRSGMFVVIFLFASFLMGMLGAAVLFLAFPNIILNDLLTNDQGKVDLGIEKTQQIIIEESSAITMAVEKIKPAVVSISTKTDVIDFFGRSFEQKGGGTGFIITSDGLIVTNKHVVADDTTTYTVFTSDGKDYSAKVVDRDPLNDLAILKIETNSLPTVELGSSTDLKIGQWVIAIGNALGEFSNSVTVGVVSAKERQITASGGGISERLSGLIQTDAAINPGNSGGPLVNLGGQVIGINTAIAGGAENIGFAIPIDTIKKAISMVIKTGEIKRPMIGIRYIPITKELATVNQLPVDYGIWVLGGDEVGRVAVIPSSPADKAGIKENDIITEINGTRIDEDHPLLSRLSDYNVGDVIELKVISGGEERMVKLTLRELK